MIITKDERINLNEELNDLIVWGIKLSKKSIETIKKLNKELELVQQELDESEDRNEELLDEISQLKRKLNG